MGGSFNLENMIIRYDLRLDEYIELYQFESEIVLNCTLPYLLPKLNESYCVKAETGQFRSSLMTDRERMVAFSGTRNWLNNQKVSIRQSTLDISSEGNTVFCTSLTIAIEVKSDEADAIKNAISDEKLIIKEMCNLLQSSLEIILYRYNEKADGKSFRTPSYFDCDRIHCLFIKNYFEKRSFIWEFICPNSVMPDGIDESPISRIDMEREAITWRYYKNKANYHFVCCEYLDSIISSAISIESFVLSTVRSFCQSNDEEENYISQTHTNELGLEVKTFLTMHKLVKKLKKDGKITIALSNEKIDSCISKILNPRNDIMHGKIPISTQMHDQATVVIEELNRFYSSVNFSDNSENLEDRKVGFTDHKEYLSFLKLDHDQEATIQEKITNAERILLSDPRRLYPKFTLSRLFFEIGEMNKAKELWDELLKHMVNKTNIIMEIALLLSKTDVLQALEIINTLPDYQKDERIFTLTAYIYISMYKCKQCNEYLDMAKMYISASHNIETNYVLNYRLLRELSDYTSDYHQSLLCGECMYKIEQRDYESILYSAECHMKLSEWVECSIEMFKFIEAYSQNNHAAYLLDYYLIKYDKNSIFSRAMTVLEFLKTIVTIDQAKIHSAINRLKIIMEERDLSGILNGRGPYIIAPSENWQTPHLLKMEFPVLRTLANDVRDFYKCIF